MAGRPRLDWQLDDMDRWVYGGVEGSCAEREAVLLLTHTAGDTDLEAEMPLVTAACVDDLSDEDCSEPGMTMETYTAASDGSFARAEDSWEQSTRSDQAGGVLPNWGKLLEPTGDGGSQPAVTMQRVRMLMAGPRSQVTTTSTGEQAGVAGLSGLMGPGSAGCKAEEPVVVPATKTMVWTAGVRMGGASPLLCSSETVGELPIPIQTGISEDMSPSYVPYAAPCGDGIGCEAGMPPAVTAAKTVVTDAKTVRCAAGVRMGGESPLLYSSEPGGNYPCLFRLDLVMKIGLAV